MQVIGLLLILVMTPLSTVLAGGLGDDVCSEMAAKGTSLLSENAGEFYFVRALGGDFPVPAFMEVRPPAEFVDITVQAANVAGFPATSWAEKVRMHGNPCGWFMTAHFGKRTDLEPYFGGAAELAAFGEKQTVEGFTVWIRDEPLRTTAFELQGVVVANDDGFAHFISTSIENVMWLVRLFNELNQPIPPDP